MNDKEAQTLVDMVRRFDSREDIESAGFIPGWHGEPVEVGEQAVVYGHGGWRLGLVTKVTDMWVYAQFTTPGAITEAQRIVDTALGRDPLREMNYARREAEKNWDFFAKQVGPNPLYGGPHTPEQRAEYQARVDEGRENYVDRMGVEAAERVRKMSKDAREKGVIAYVNVTNGKGDRTGKKGTNLYVRPR